MTDKMPHGSSIPLSPPDLCFLGENAATIQFVFAWAGHINQTSLQESLAKALTIFYPVTSSIDLSGKTPRFKPADTNLNVVCSTTKEELDLEDPAVSATLVDEVISLPGHALAKFRLTLTPTRSLLGVSISHTLVDGYSYFMFMNYWAALCRGETPAWQPSHDRSKLLALAEENLNHDPLAQVDAQAFETRTGLAFAGPREHITALDTRWMPKHISARELAGLKGDAAQGLSLNDLLTAKLWQEVARTWNKPGDLLELSCPMDCRRFYPGAGTTYFGNFIRACMVKLSHDELIKSAAIDVAKKIRSAVSAVDRAAFERSLGTMLALWREQGLAGTQRVHVAKPGVGFLVTNMSRLDSRGIDFGLGAPIFISTPTPAKRVATILAHHDGVMVQISEP